MDTPTPKRRLGLILAGGAVLLLLGIGVALAQTDTTTPAPTTDPPASSGDSGIAHDGHDCPLHAAKRSGSSASSSAGPTANA